MKKFLFFITMALFFLSACATNKNVTLGKERVTPETDSKDSPKEKEKSIARIDEDLGTIEIKVYDKNKNLKVQQNTKKNDTKIQPEVKSKNNYYSDYKIREQELKSSEVGENKTIYLSISDTGWSAESIKPKDIITLVKKEDFDKNTLFQFNTNRSGKAEILFTRTDNDRKIIFRQPYVLYISKNGSENNSSVKSQEKVKMDKNSTDKKNQAVNLYNDRNYEKAREILLQLLEDGYSDPSIYYYLGLIEKILANNDKALAYFSKVLSFKSSNFYLPAILEMMGIYKSLNKYNDALALYYRIDFSFIKDKSRLEELYLLLGDIYFNLKNYSRASEEYKKFIDKYPMSDLSAKALFYYAYSLENLPVNPDFKEAYRIYKLIVAQYPSTSYYELSKNRMIYLERHYFKLN